MSTDSTAHLYGVEGYHLRNAGVRLSALPALLASRLRLAPPTAPQKPGNVGRGEVSMYS